MPQPKLSLKPPSHSGNPRLADPVPRMGIAQVRPFLIIAVDFHFHFHFSLPAVLIPNRGPDGQEGVGGRRSPP